VNRYEPAPICSYFEHSIKKQERITVLAVYNTTPSPVHLTLPFGGQILILAPVPGWIFIPLET